MTAIERVEKFVEWWEARPRGTVAPPISFADLREVVALAKLGHEIKDNGARLRSAARAWKRKPRANGKR